MNRDFFKAKIDCAVNRAKLRGLVITTSYQGNVKPNREYVLNNSGTAFILDLLIEGRFFRPQMHVYAVSRVLGTDINVVVAFNMGFCGCGSYWDYSGSDSRFAYTLGNEYRKKLLPGV
jgi:hypothetical protein